MTTDGRHLAGVLVDTLRALRAARRSSAALREALAVSVTLLREANAALDAARRQNRALRTELRTALGGKSVGDDHEVAELDDLEATAA